MGDCPQTDVQYFSDPFPSLSTELPTFDLYLSVIIALSHSK